VIERSRADATRAHKKRAPCTALGTSREPCRLGTLELTGTLLACS